MRRKLSLFVLALTVTLAGACANPAAPNRDDDGETERCGVTVGTQTRCADDDTTTTTSNK